MPNKKHDWPTVTTTTIAKKIAEGFKAEGWEIVGQGGSQIGALMPLLRYLASKGVVVHESEGHKLRGTGLIKNV